MASVLSDALILAGLGALDYGLYSIHPTAMWLALGAEMIFAGVRLGRIE